MHRVFSVLSVATLLATPALAQAPAGRQTTPPAVGIVQSFDGKVLTVKANDGTILPITVPGNVMISYNAKRTLADIKPGDFIASGGTRGPDGKIRANEIRIFTGARGEGQFPMQQPDQVMTNATVTQVMTNATVQNVASASGTPVIKLSFHGAQAPGAANCTGRSADAPGGTGKGCVGETEFEVPANVAVVAILPGDVSMLKPGAKVSVNVTPSADGGSATATRITVSDQ
jgi:hypothetical protein